MDGNKKAGCLPMSANAANAPMTEERTTRPIERLLIFPTISSRTKVIAASGALKAAAHEDSRSFAPEAHSSAYAEDSGDEFHDDRLELNEPHLFPISDLELRDTAPCGIGANTC
jgi:hypothetical protein